jgi:hypothetical protein
MEPRILATARCVDSRQIVEIARKGEVLIWAGSLSLYGNSFLREVFMSNIRKVFMTIIRTVWMSIILCAFVGALGAGFLAFCVYIAVGVFLPVVLGGWGGVALIGFGLESTVVGCALGGIYGAIRNLPVLKTREPTVPIAISVLYGTVYVTFIVCNILSNIANPLGK